MNSEDKPPSGIFFQEFIKESPFVPGDDGEILEGKQIPWLNPKLVKEGQDFVFRNSFAINLAHTAALLFGFSFKNLTTILLRTGKFSNTSNSVIRYLETEMHILNWYESDILAQKDEGFKDIQIVRKMHALALKKSLKSPVQLFEDVPDREKCEGLNAAIRKDLTCFATSDSPLDLMTYDPKVLMSQFDMAMTQYGFVGLVYLFPDILGIKNKEGMDGFIHLWAVIGRLIGIQDRFNIALHGDQELFVQIFKTIGMASLMQSDVTAVVLQESFSGAVAKLLGFTTLKSSLYFALKGAGELEPAFTGENIYKLMNWWDMICLKILQLTLFLIYHFDIVRVGINSLMRRIKLYQRKKVLGAKGKFKNGGRNRKTRMYKFA